MAIRYAINEQTGEHVPFRSAVDAQGNRQWIQVSNEMVSQLQDQETAQDRGQPDQLRFDESQPERNLTRRQRIVKAQQKRRSEAKQRQKNKLDQQLAAKLMADKNISAEQALDLVKAKRKVAAETTGVEATAASLGKWASDMVSGAKDILGKSDKWIYEQLGMDEAAQEEQAGLEARQKERDENWLGYQLLESEHPGATTLGGDVLSAAATLPLSLGTAPVRIGLGQTGKAATAGRALQTAETTAREAAIGATEGAINPEDTALGGALASAIGTYGGKKAADWLGGAPKNLTPQQEATVNWAEKQNLFVPPGVATGNPLQQGVDRYFSQTAGIQDIWKDKVIDSKRKESMLISKELPETTDNFNQEYLDRQRSIISNKMDDLTKDYSGQITDNDALNVTQILEDYKAQSIDQITPPVLNRYEDMLYNFNDKGKPFTGQNFQDFNRNIKNSITAAYRTGDVGLANALRDIQGTVVDSMGGNIGKEWKKVNRQYKLLNDIERTLPVSMNKFASGEEGFVDPIKLSKRFSTNDDINNLARFNRLSQLQPGQNLSSLANMSSILFDTPTNKLASGLMLTGRTTKRIPLVSNIAPSLYLSGYPTKHGIFGQFMDDKMKGYLPGLTGRLSGVGGDFGTSEEEREREERIQMLLDSM